MFTRRRCPPRLDDGGSGRGPALQVAAQLKRRPPPSGHPLTQLTMSNAPTLSSADPDRAELLAYLTAEYDRAGFDSSDPDSKVWATEEAAYYLNRRPQTLRGWACLENGPICPRRVGGLLAWNTAEVKALAGVTA